MEIFKLEGHAHVALCDLLKLQGWTDSGALAKSVIDAGLVTVDGVVEARKRCKILADQVVSYEGQQVKVEA